MGDELTSGTAKSHQRAGGSLVGREREMAQLGEALDGAFAGRGTVVLLAGEPGIGKTSIARALSDEAEARGAAAVWGIGWAGNAAPAYWPWVQVVRALVRRPDGDDLLAGLRPGAAWLGEIVPELGTEVSGLPRLPRGSAEEGRFHVYDALAELLRRAAAEAPVLVVLDDLQWADEASLLTLAFVARALPDAGVVLLGTYRTTEVPHDELGTSRLADLIGWSRRIELRGLAAADVRRLVEDSRQRWRAGRGRRAHPLPDRRKSALRLRAAHAAGRRGPARRRLGRRRVAAARGRSRGDRAAAGAADAGRP